MALVFDRTPVPPEPAKPGGVPTEDTGLSSPLGATIVPGGVNFSVFSRTASDVDLLLFDREDDAEPARVIHFDPVANLTYHYWHVFVPGVRPGQLYGYRVRGPFDPPNGLRFDSSKVLLDPYGRAIAVPGSYSREAASREGDNTAKAVKSVVVDPRAYDWEGEKPLHRPAVRTIIYETHVRGFTRHPNSGLSEKIRGTDAGMVEKIPYLRELGITAVELLPIFQYDAQDCHGVKLGQPDWSPWSHSLALSAESPKEKVLFHVILNAYWQPLEFELPLPASHGAGPWRRWIDTALDSPHDIVEWKEAQSISSPSYRAGSRSVAVLFATVEEFVP